MWKHKQHSQGWSDDTSWHADKHHAPSHLLACECLQVLLCLVVIKARKCLETNQMHRVFNRKPYLWDLSKRCGRINDNEDRREVYQLEFGMYGTREEHPSQPTPWPLVQGMKRIGHIFEELFIFPGHSTQVRTGHLVSYGGLKFGRPW